MNYFLLLNAGLADNSMVALHYVGNRVAVAKPGDKNWIRLDTTSGIISALPYRGRFYCATGDNIAVLQAREGQQQPELVVAANYELEIDYPMNLYLAEHDDVWLDEARKLARLTHGLTRFGSTRWTFKSSQAHILAR